MKNVTDWAIAIPRSILTIALIPPILKYVFGVQKKSKAAPEPTVQEQPKNTLKMVSRMDGFMNKLNSKADGGSK